MLWIVDIVAPPPFSTNFKIDMVGFVDPHKVILRKNAFSTFPNTWNEGELKGGAESGGLKSQFSQMKGALNLQKMLKLVLIHNKRKTSKNKIIVVSCAYNHPLCVIK
jgi:hypothetical protein